MTTNRPIRVVMAKPGLDGHDRGIKILARSFQEAGMEVIYLGLRQTPEMIVNAAIQEDADVIAVSILSGAHMTYFTDIKSLMDAKGVENVLLTGGGIIPEKDMKELNNKGIGKLFGPGSDISESIDYVKNWCKENRHGQ
jgi:methylmalonyl-CoA mutase C-terminal domain/subunit|tara:strand:+ start:3482 stop:3898 length:417 start_codon:yes stop_codon:yes gene_type:complete